MNVPLDKEYITSAKTDFLRSARRGFTMVEMLIAMAVFLILMAVLLSMIGQSGAILQRTQNEVGSYRAARFAFNLITRTLSQSRMNVYENYDSVTAPTTYLRKSDLHFVIDSPSNVTPSVTFNQGNAVFFQAPLGQTQSASSYGGLPGLLNSVGYYVTYGKNPSLPFLLQGYDRNRFRLMQFLAPAENMTVYVTNANPKAWFQTPLQATPPSYINVIADNVILLLFWPRLSIDEDAAGSELTSNYLYDSAYNATLIPQPPTANQQPPLVQVTLVAIDETFAARLPNTAAPPSVITSALQGLFASSTQSTYTSDLNQLEKNLTQAHIGYQVFNSMVQLRETKWDKQ